MVDLSSVAEVDCLDGSGTVVVRVTLAELRVAIVADILLYLYLSTI